MANDFDQTIHEPGGASSSRTQPSSYWFDDGSVIARLRNHDFKVHRGLLDRHSPYIASLQTRSNEHGLPILKIPEDRATLRDFQGLLGYLYHDLHLDDSSTYSFISSLLCVSSEKQLHYPSIYERARRRLEEVFPSTMEHFVHPDEPENALKLSIEHGIRPIQKALYYSVATTLHFEHGDSAASSSLPPDVTRRCSLLQDSIISHFTPILFTVATALHMSCTDIFAEKWMPLVIAPALDNNGLCTPIETLRSIHKIDWESEGLCAECCKEKRAEWEEEARTIWNKVDEWLGLSRI